jgi:Glycosyl transferases group 1/Glycosyl transferase 4-like
MTAAHRPKILFVAMQGSIHVARWIDTLSASGYDLHIFPVNDADPNPNLHGVTLHWPVAPKKVAPGDAVVSVKSKNAIGLWPNGLRVKRFLALCRHSPAEARRRLFSRIAVWAKGKYFVGTGDSLSLASSGFDKKKTLRRKIFEVTVDDYFLSDGLIDGQVRLGESESCAPRLNGPKVLARLVRELKPDLVHSMEFQHCGYLSLRAKELYGEGFPPWLATNWGSDIFYFQRFLDHRSQIIRLLSSIDFYSCECERDIAIARELGMTCKALPVLPNSGGFNLPHLESLKTGAKASQRTLIMVKGYEHFAGRAMIALDVLEAIAESLEGFEVVMFSVSAEPRKRAIELKAQRKLDIRVIDWATHDEILSHFGRARIYLGVSISDGVSTSCLEAMAMGAFPIQTNTACCDEWFDDGVGGFVISAENPEKIRQCVERALRDDALVDSAQVVNANTVKVRLDLDLMAGKLNGFYQEIFNTIDHTSGRAKSVIS